MKKLIKIISLSLLFLFILDCTSSALQDVHEENVIHLENDTTQIELDPFIEILIDKKRAYSIEEIASGKFDHQFFTYTGTGRPNFGYTSAAYWVRIHINNLSSIEKWLLEIDTPKINRIHLYIPQSDGHFQEKLTGNAFPFNQRKVHHRNFVYQLSPTTNQTETYYLHFTTGSSMQIPLKIWNPSAYDEKSQIGYMLFGMLIGVSVVMALYNLFLYFSIGDKSYLYYVLFVILNGLLYLSDTGIAFQYLWPEEVNWNLKAVVTFMCLDNIGALLFTRSFFKTSQLHPRLNSLFTILILINVLPAAWIHFSYFGVVESAILCVICTIAIVIITVFKSFKLRFRPTRFFALAWGVFLIGVTTSVLVDTGLIPLTFFTKYAWQISTALEVALLSFALGDRFNVIRDEKISTEQRAKENRILMANIAHELGTPVTLIDGYVQAVKGGLISFNEERYIEMVKNKVNILDRLIHDLSDLAHLGEGHISLNKNKVPLHQWIQQLHHKLDFQVIQGGRQLIIRNETNPSIPDHYILMIDVDRMDQVFFNLIYNAIKHTSSTDGKIYIEVNLNTKENEVIIQITDNGDGIDEEILPHIFERFFKRKSSKVSDELEGSGLGLAIANEIIKLHNGRIWVKTVVDQGSTFFLALPIQYGE